MKIEHKYNARIVTKRVIAMIGVAAFCLGVGLTTLSVYVANKMTMQTGMGGLETPGAVDITEEDLAALASDSLSPRGSEIEEDIDSASALLDDEGTEAKEELCYYTYQVRKGDMIGHIAESFNITQDTIISVNDIHQSRMLQIGQYLKIPSIPGVVYHIKDNDTVQSIADHFEVSAKKCALVNNIALDAGLKVGDTLFVPDAQLDWATKQEINGDLFRKPLRAKYYLSSYFGWRSSPFSGKRSYHSGIDMACPSGTPVYAASSGKVTSAGYNNVYGNYVIITHNGGYKTLYGHMSAILVAPGRKVVLGTNIGRVGSTGMSTGPHLHFTVYKYGKTINPLGVIK